MTKKLTILCATLSFMVLFMSVGFASLTAQLDIVGTTKAEVPEGLFITEVSPNGATRLSTNEYSYVRHTTTVDTALKKSNSNQTSSASYKITVYNNTKHEYAYRGIYYQSNLSNYHNSTISDTAGNSKINITTNFPDGKVVAPGEYLTFYVTYNMGRSLSRNTTYKNMINYQFGINVESEAAARDAVHEKFLDILNTTSTYNELFDKIDDKFDGANEWTSNYIGNVSDAVDADSMTVETLFAGQLNMVINGQVTPATVLIKHENLDYNNYTGDTYSVTYNGQSNPTYYRGCEMTLYLTTDSLTTAYGQAPVYVTVFTCDVDDNGNRVGEWYKVGDSYAGKAPIVGYRGETGGTGSFVTDNWVADGATYATTDSFSYTVSQGTTIKTLTQQIDDNAIAELQRLLIAAKAMIEDLTYAGTGITIVEDAYAAAYRYYTVDDSGNPIAKADVTRAQILPAIIDLDYALTEAQKAIDALPKI